MRRRRRKKSGGGIIAILIILLLSITIGYATLGTTLNIKGTATANGTFSIEFISANIINSQGISNLKSGAEITDTKDSIIVNIADMAYPGAGATISCVIKNTGTIPAILKNIKFTGNDDPDISIIFSDEFKTGTTLAVNEVKTLQFAIKWNKDSEISTPKALNFSATLEYEQNVEEYQVGF
jgi:hypothetical protein